MKRIISTLLWSLFTIVMLSSTVAMVAAQDFNYDFSSCNFGQTQPLILGGARPASRLLSDVDLLSQPLYSSYGDNEPLVIATLPRDMWVVVFDLDEQTQGWFRVFVACDEVAISGWIPADPNIINHSLRRTNNYAAPPGCARPLDVVESFDELWESTISGRVAVAFDVFRDNTGERIQNTFFYPTRNGRELRDKERRIETGGAYLLTGSVVSVELQQGNRLGLSIIGAPRSESLRIFGIIFEVPDGCQFAER